MSGIVTDFDVFFWGCKFRRPTARKFRFFRTFFGEWCKFQHPKTICMGFQVLPQFMVNGFRFPRTAAGSPNYGRKK